MSSILKAHAELRLNPSSNWSKYDDELSQLEVMKDAILKLVETKVDGNKEKHELKAADQAKLGGYELTHNASSMFDETDADHDPDVAREEELAAGGTDKGSRKKARVTGTLVPPVDDVLAAAIINFEAQKQVRSDARVAAAAAADAARIEMTTMLKALTAAITSLAGAGLQPQAGPGAGGL